MKVDVGKWFELRRVRRGATAGVVVLAAGGLFLLRANAAGAPQRATPARPPAHDPEAPPWPPPAAGADTVTFAGPRVHGTFSVSDARALAGPGQPFYADVTLNAEAGPGEHAPLAMVVVLDTSGSMAGDKLREAKSAVKELVRSMQDDDDIAVVDYATTAEVVQELSRVGDVRESLAARVDRIGAGGGTRIPLGLQMGAEELQRGLGRLEHSPESRVRRVVLVSDGLDSSRASSETLAEASAAQGVTVSSMGIGLDFDEAYMGAIARAGHGNFGFVDDAPTLTAFLQHELVETATTVADSTVVHLHLPDHVRLEKATGAAAEVHGRDVDLRVGALYGGEAKRVLLEMQTDLASGSAADFSGSLTWKTVGGSVAEATIPQVEVLATRDAAAVSGARNETVFARVASVEASERQIEAAKAYAEGDAVRAEGLIQQSIAQLARAARSAPKPVASALSKQSESYGSTLRDFASAPPGSTSGRVAVKKAAAVNMANSQKVAF